MQDIWIQHMHTRLCQENGQRLPVHPDEMILDMMGLVQRLQKISLSSLDTQQQTEWLLLSHIITVNFYNKL